MESTDVLVIGSGIAGLCAAIEAARTGATVAVASAGKTMSGSSFFREPVNHLIRFHFAKKDETLLAALENLKSLRDTIPSRC